MSASFDEQGLEEDPHATYYESATSEIPIEVSAGETIFAEGGTAFWVENIRAYSRGLTFETRLVVSGDLHERMAMPVGPHLSGDFDPLVDEPSEEFHLWARVDDMEDATKSTLHALDAGAVPRLLFAKWWLPQRPSASLIIGFDWPSASLTGESRIDLFPTDSSPELL